MYKGKCYCSSTLYCLQQDHDETSDEENSDDSEDDDDDEDNVFAVNTVINISENQVRFTGT